MIPIFKKKYFMIALKFASLVFIFTIGSYILYTGNAIARAAVLVLATIAIAYRIRNYLHNSSNMDDDVGYWSGLDDFELGLDLSCFDDYDEDDELETIAGDFCDKSII